MELQLPSTPRSGLLRRAAEKKFLCMLCGTRGSCTKSMKNPFGNPWIYKEINRKCFVGHHEKCQKSISTKSTQNADWYTRKMHEIIGKPMQKPMDLKGHQPKMLGGTP